MKTCFRRSAAFGLCALLFAWLGPQVLAAPDATKWTIDGVEREGLIFPPSASSERAPVIFVFHGHGGSMNTAAQMGFQGLWPEAVVVCLQGLPTPTLHDPEGKQAGWEMASGQEGDRDLKFFDAALSTVRQSYPVDEHRIYAAGFSNGAIFTYLLWSKRGNVFAAYGACAGKVPIGGSLGPARPLALIAGEKDDVIPFKEQLETLSIVRNHNGCAGEGKPLGQLCTVYPSSKGAPLVTYIHPGGHVYPSGTTTIMVKMFKNHALGS